MSDQRVRRRKIATSHASRRARRRRYGPLVLVIILLVAVGISIWWTRTRDDGVSGTAIFQFQTADVHSLVFDLADADTLFFGHHGGLSVSEDGGFTWLDSSLSGADAMQQSVALAEPPRHYVAGHDVFMVSVDDGATWQPQPNNLPSLDLHSFAGSPSDANRLYAVPAGMGLWTSNDGGATWTETALPSTPDTQPVALAVAPNRPERVYLARGGQIAISDDAGANWQTTPAPEGIVYTIAVAADVDETLYAGTNQGLWRRPADGSWERMAVEASGDILALAISPAQPLRVAVVDSNGNFYRSDDGGASWIDS